MAQPKFKVDFEPLGKRVEVTQGTTLIEAARMAGLPLTADCGGAGSCGQCRVIARDGHLALNPPTLTEQVHLTPADRASGFRLACQAEVSGDIKIDLPPASLITEQRLQVDSQIQRGMHQSHLNDRVVQSYQVAVPEPDLHDPRGDFERVLAVLAEQGCAGLSANPAALRNLPGLLRMHQWQVQVLVRDHTIMGFLAPEARPVGLAVDLGTTKVAAYLVNILSGETLAAEGRPNPQIGYGEDVVSRLAYAMNHPNGASTLALAVRATLVELSQALAARMGIPTANIVEACIVGNTAMLHLLLELPIRQLAMAPYVPVTALPQEITAADLGLPFAGDVRVYLPACVAGYVGADLVAMTYASGIGQDDRVVLGIDIGTNTEIVLSMGRKSDRRGMRGLPRMFSLSCASGPAFEGAHIKAGMRAAAGAIERVRLNGDKPRFETIGGGLPVGICGSGIIDAVAEMRRVGVINARGRLQTGLPGVRESANGHDGVPGLEFLLVAAEETGTGEAISITQHDVDEIQFAKGAIKAGITVLLEVSGLSLDDLDEIVLAGAFGSYLNLDTATAIELLPDIPLEKYRQVGNAAGDGAQQLLVSSAARSQTAEMARQIEYIELSTYPGFRRIYARAMALD